MTRPSLALVRRAARAGVLTGALAGAALTAACGRGPNQSADRNGADTTSASPTTYGAPVGANKPANDSAFANAHGTLDSLKGAGVTTKNGLDSVGSQVQAQTANEPGHDTSHLNNRATPGGVSPRGRRP